MRRADRVCQGGNLHSCRISALVARSRHYRRPTIKRPRALKSFPCQMKIWFATRSCTSSRSELKSGKQLLKRSSKRGQRKMHLYVALCTRMPTKRIFLPLMKDGPHPVVDAFRKNQITPYQLAHETKLKILLQCPREPQVLKPSDHRSSGIFICQGAVIFSPGFGPVHTKRALPNIRL